MLGVPTGDRQQRNTNLATTSSLGGNTSPSRQELSSASAMAISHSKNQRTKIGIEGTHMTGLDFSND